MLLLGITRHGPCICLLGWGLFALYAGRIWFRSSCRIIAMCTTQTGKTPVSGTHAPSDHGILTTPATAAMTQALIPLSLKAPEDALQQEDRVAVTPSQPHEFQLAVGRACNRDYND